MQDWVLFFFVLFFFSVTLTRTFLTRTQGIRSRVCFAAASGAEKAALQGSRLLHHCPRLLGPTKEPQGLCSCPQVPPIVHGASRAFCINGNLRRHVLMYIVVFPTAGVSRGGCISKQWRRHYRPNSAAFGGIRSQALHSIFLMRDTPIHYERTAPPPL